MFSLETIRKMNRPRAVASSRRRARALNNPSGHAKDEEKGRRTKRIRYCTDDRGNRVRHYTQKEMEAEARRNQDVVFHVGGWKISDSAGH